MRILAVILLSCGVGLFLYGLLRFDVGSLDPSIPTAPIYYYTEKSRLEASIGAVLATAGYLILKSEVGRGRRPLRSEAVKKPFIGLVKIRECRKLAA